MTTAPTDLSPDTDTDIDRRRTGPWRARHLARRGPALLAALVLVAAACGGDDDDTSAAGGSETGSESGGGGGGGEDMSIEVVTPADGDSVEVPFDVEVDPSVDIGETDTGLHHVHLYYDGATGEGDYDLLYDETFTVERDLGEGEHTLEAVIANADHSLTDARAELTVTVGGAGGGSGGSDTTEGGGYEY